MAALLCGLLAASAPIAKTSQAGTCDHRETGADTSYANFYLWPFLGQAFGQTFLATDTLIESITVWRWAEEDTSFVGYELFIVGTDSSGMPDVVNKLLLEGKVAYSYYGDGVHPIPITFLFDPPFALPAPGEYEFAVQLVPCTAESYLYMSTNDPYPDGQHWRHSQSAMGGCYLRPGPNDFPNVDMIFTIAFCDQSVPIEANTWGEIKARYR